MKRDHVAIVGGGFSGTLLAVNLLRHDGPRATLIERRQHTARGVAYSAAHPDHLLNVRAENMSALPDDPEHFVRWLEEHRPGVGGFVPRLVYGDYLDDLLAETMRESPGRLEVLCAEVEDVVPGTRGVTLSLANGETLAADSAVLAPGNLPPHTPAGLAPAALPSGSYVTDPWHGDILSGLGADDTLLVLGTGLTMVDIALLADARGFAGKVVALSRHGLVPRAHVRGVPATRRSERPAPTASAMIAALRERATKVDWRAAVDELRPYTQGLWRAMDVAERQRFLRHLRPWWDVHRHRLAPSVAKKIEAMRADGRLTILAGKVTGAEPDGDGIRLSYRPRHADAEETLHVRRIVNGTGPQGDLTATHEPLLANLRDRGLLRADPLRIGIDVDQDARAIAADGASSDRLTVIGPMTRGAFWEIVAVPDIRRQAWSVARRLSNAQWVEGEGL
ncbi:FAD/NAD(P)-binding protein [Sphingomonas oryzagri]|uniref:FAD-dependent oxidoreductase n=1 Tax=Sphingomonas oryzagri TaxID=3042314 RepID=A0ABT6N4N6_9SPHN|nr:FAD/NAD(P)-binding protein [Sphingomonas oryzagri]MDH7639873.1 FAD-dependent oxidoreductase [Sphingomonas oryzagri]